jgi:hypothetical protein
MHLADLLKTLSLTDGSSGMVATAPMAATAAA